MFNFMRNNEATITTSTHNPFQIIN